MSVTNFAAPPARARIMNQTSRSRSRGHRRLLSLGSTVLLCGWWLPGCPGNTATAPAPVAQRPAPSTTRPLAVPAGAALEYTIDGPLGILDHPESKRQIPRPRTLTLRGAGDGITFDLTLHAIPAGHKPPIVVPDGLSGALDRFGMVRRGDPPIHGGRGEEDHAADPAVGERLYGMLVSLMLQRPTDAAEGKTSWNDIAWFGFGPEDQFGGLLQVTREPSVTLGGRTCEKYRWRLETGLPRHYLAQIQLLEATGITLYDPAAQAVAAAEVEFRFSDRPTAWRFQPWNWIRISLPDVNYVESALDGLWIDPAFTLEQDERAADFDKRVAEDTAIKRLFGIGEGQKRFIAEALVDLDGDGAGEAGFLGELSGATNLRTPGAVVGPKIKVFKGGAGNFGMHRRSGQCAKNGVALDGQYCIQMFLAASGATGALAEGLLPPNGDPAHADAQEAKLGWSCFMWPDAGSPGQLVLWVNAEGTIYGTYDLPWRGVDGGPPAPVLKRPSEGITWKVRTHAERVPPPMYQVRILAPNLDVPKDTYPLLAQMSASFVRLQIPDLFSTLPKGSDTMVRALESRWREAWRDRRVSVEELRPIVEQFEAVLLGKYVPGLLPMGTDGPPQAPK